jgi:hypothetical protein
LSYTRVGNPPAKGRFILERKAGETITSVLHRELLAAIDAGLPQLMAHGASFLRTIEGSSALRARVRLGFEKAEASLAETIAEETEAVASDPTPQIVAAMLVAIQRTLMERAGAAALRLAERDRGRAELFGHGTVRSIDRQPAHRCRRIPDLGRRHSRGQCLLARRRGLAKSSTVSERSSSAGSAAPGKIASVEVV